MELLVMLILLVIVGALILWPLLRPQAASPPAAVPADESHRGRIALNAIKELEFDFATGKIAEDDYKALRTRYEAKAVEVLTRPQPAPKPADLDAELEGAIRAARGRRVCASCGGSLPAAARFCPACGTPLAKVRR